MDSQSDSGSDVCCGYSREGKKKKKKCHAGTQKLARYGNGRSRQARADVSRSVRLKEHTRW